MSVTRLECPAVQGELASTASAKACSALGYRARPPEQALTDAVEWFKTQGYLA